MTEKLHIGDNLEFMKTLKSKSIDLIYGDILYGTGRDFGDYKDLKIDYKNLKFGIIPNNIYDFYFPRIAEMHRLLKDTGSIYLQMDTRINHWLRIILDDIFGHDNFRNSIVWKKRQNTTNVKTNNFLNNTDFILFYSKSKRYNFNTQRTPISNETVKRYNKFDENKGKYQLQSIKTTYNKIKTIIFNNKEYTNTYMWKQQTFDKRIKEGYIIELNSLGELAYRIYLKDNKGKQLSNIWTDLTERGGLQNEYPTKKPQKLMSRIIKSSSNENDTIADFFAGSGSFVVAGKKLNRNIIACDINPKAIEITKKRLNEATDLFNYS